MRIPVLPNHLRSVLVFAFDLLAVAVAWYGGMLLRFNFSPPLSYFTSTVLVFALLVLAHGLACRWAGLYRGIWVFASLPDLKRVLKAVALSTAALAVLMALHRHDTPAIPRSMIVLYPLLLLAIMGGGRALWRMWKEYRLYGGLQSAGKPVLIVGAGTGGAMLVRELERSPDWRVVALLDDDRAKWGREIMGHPVIGEINRLPQALLDYKAHHVILAMPSAAAETQRRATDLAVRAGAMVFTVPGLEDLMHGKVEINAMRPVDISDLLGREPVRIDATEVRAMVAERTVLITGAGGSIGSELCRQLARFEPRRLVLLDSSEYSLYTIEQWFVRSRPQVDIVALVGDVKDATRMAQVFDAWAPQVVMHAAAYKHVPLMETGNAWEAVRNNVLGTWRVAECALRHGVERFVLISTDKAVNPTSVMGASKRLAEMVCEALHARAQAAQAATRFGMVRFGNVLGSTGSVIPKFAEQIARGGPVTVTHPDITRYFMSIPEAAQLVLQAAAMGRGGEIFVLDMGEPVRIVDLARNMIRLSGRSEDEIHIQFVGLRPGEKLYEELMTAAEHTRETPHPKLRIARSRAVATSLLAELGPWLAQASVPDDDEVRRQLLRWVPEYASARGRPQLRVVDEHYGQARS